MTIVVDANVLVVLLSGDPRTEIAQVRMREWVTGSEDLHAPTLLAYEVANGLTRLVAGGHIPPGRSREAWQMIVSLPITYHPLEAGGDRVVEMALRLRRQSAYDAAYLVLAQQLRAELWTFDGPLARNAGGLGFPDNLLG